MVDGSDDRKTVCLGTIRMEDVRPVHELVPRGTGVMFDVEDIKEGDLDRCREVLTTLTRRDRHDQPSIG